MLTADTLNMRLDAVEELLAKETVFWDLLATLPQFADLGKLYQRLWISSDSSVDHLHSQLVQVPKHQSQVSGNGVLPCAYSSTDYHVAAERTVYNLLLLKKMLILLPQLA